MKYSVFIEWGLDSNGPYENCFIAPSDESEDFQDGENYVSKGGSEGMKFNIYDSLDEAVEKSGFIPTAITFNNIPEEMLKKYRVNLPLTENGIPQY